MLTYLKHSKVKPSHFKCALGLILLIYLVLAVTYSVVVPIGKGADEWAHFWYVQFIAQHHRLPANPIERKIAGYKSDWPPLYHLSAAAVTGWIATDGPPFFKYRADNIRRQLIPAQGSEAILHTEDELFPWQQEILVWHLGRFLSIGFTLGTLLVTYVIAVEVFQSSKLAGSRVAGEKVSRFSFPVSPFAPQTLALASVAVLAFMPRFLFTGMVFGYDSLTLLWASLFLWLAIRVAKGYHRRWGFLALGVLAGLALMTKYLAVLLPLEIVLLALSRAAKRRRGEEARKRGEEMSHRFTVSPPHASRLTFHLLPLLPAALAFLLVTSGWFSYLLINFNEVDTYGPVLGTLAPLLRGDGSDRTIEQIFAWFGGSQVPLPDHIDQQYHPAWQIIAEFFITFWGNPVTRPYPLNWFVMAMTGVGLFALIGLLIMWRTASLPKGLVQPSNRFLASSPPRLLLLLLLLHCLLPLPFMVIRLFGARDALEAVQGRHLLFLSGPAIAILLVMGIVNASSLISRLTLHASRFTLYGLLGLLLTGSISQLISMQQVYPPPLPVRTTPYTTKPVDMLPTISLPGGAQLIDYHLTLSPNSSWVSSLFTAYPTLNVALIWRGGAEPAPEDYRLELALVDAQGQTRASWLAYQTQAHYPTRVWEAGDTIRDEGWLPLAGLPAGDYEVRWRLWGENEPLLDWQTLTTYRLAETINPPAVSKWLLWRDGVIPSQPPILHERETVQITFSDPQSPTSNLQPLTPNPQLIGPDGLPRSPISIGPTWANFIIDPAWPPGDYQLGGNGSFPLLRLAENGRNFQLPAITYPVGAFFENQINLLGYDLSNRRVQPGQGLPVTFYWQGLHWMGEDFVIFERLLDNQEIAWGGYDRRAKENYSTLYWAPGEVVTDGFAVPVAPDAPEGVYRLTLGWYRQVNGEAQSLPILDAVNGQPTGLTAVTIGPIKVGGPPPGVTVAAATPRHEVNVVLGEQIKLLGFDVANGEWMNGETEDGTSDSASSPASRRLPASSPLRLTLYWQALTQPSADYTIFAHVHNAAGETVAQKDSPPAGGAYPTSLWDAGEIIKDELTIPLDQLKPGLYQVVVGLYNFTTGERLAVEKSVDNAVLLQSLEVTGQ